MNKPGRHHLNQVIEVNSIVSNGAKEALCASWYGSLRTHIAPVLLVLTKRTTWIYETASDKLNSRTILQNRPHTHTTPQQWKAKIEGLSQIQRLTRLDNKYSVILHWILDWSRKIFFSCYKIHYIIYNTTVFYNNWKNLNKIYRLDNSSKVMFNFQFWSLNCDYVKGCPS